MKNEPLGWIRNSASANQHRLRMAFAIFAEALDPSGSDRIFHCVPDDLREPPWAMEHERPTLAEDCERALGYCVLPAPRSEGCETIQPDSDLLSDGGSTSSM
jgi:hypothetical protein